MAPSTSDFAAIEIQHRIEVLQTIKANSDIQSFTLVSTTALIVIGIFETF